MAGRAENWQAIQDMILSINNTRLEKRIRVGKKPKRKKAL
jgi:hypothetical protein